MSFKYNLRSDDLVVLLEYLKNKIGNKSLDESIEELKKAPADAYKIYIYRDIMAKRHFKFNDNTEKILPR